MTEWKCPNPDCGFTEDVHREGSWCRVIPNVPHAEGYTEQHWPKRSRGGKEIVALLCAYCHDKVDNGYHWSNAVIEVNRRRYYRMWDLNNNTLIERELDGLRQGLAGGIHEGGEDRPHDLSGSQLDLSVRSETSIIPERISDGILVSEPSPDVSDLSLQDGRLDASTSNQVRPGGVGEGVVRVEDGAGREIVGRGAGSVVAPPRADMQVMSPELGSVRDWGIRLIDANRKRTAASLEVAMLLKVGLDRYGEEAWSYVSEAGISLHSVHTALSVISAFESAPEILTSGLDYSVIAEIAPVYRKDAQEGAELVSRAQAEQLTVSELRALKSGSERVSVKRWTHKELFDLLRVWQHAQPHLWCTCGGVFGFLDYLENPA